MNAITIHTEPTVELALIEILDADGNPTGQYKPAGDGEAAHQGTTFVSAEDGDHEVTVH